MLKGDILGKHITDFLPPAIAQKLLKYNKLALQSGTTHTYRFSTKVDGCKRYQEARISAIGAIEVLVMIRDIADGESNGIEGDDVPETNGDISVRAVSQQELTRLLEMMLEDTKNNDRHHVLCYLAVDQQETSENQNVVFIKYAK